MFGTPEEGSGHGSITAGRVVFIGPWEKGERVYATGEAADRLNGAHVLTAGLFVNLKFQVLDRLINCFCVDNFEGGVVATGDLPSERGGA